MNKKNIPMIQFVGVDPNDFAKNIVFGISKNIEKTLREIEAQKEEFLTTEEVAGLLKVNIGTVYRWAGAEERILIPRTIGNTVRYKRSDIEALLNREPDLKKKVKP